MKEKGQTSTVDKFTPENVLPLMQSLSDMVEKKCHRFLSRRYGLTMPQYQLLMAAMLGDATTLGGLADELNCSRGNLTGVADRLERDGWLVRERSTEDRRVVNIRLTEKGAKVWEIKRELAKEQEELAKIWSADERMFLVKCLERLYQDLKENQATDHEEQREAM